MWNWLDWVWSFAQRLLNDLWGWIEWLWHQVGRLADWALDCFKAVWGGVVWFAQHVWRGITALRHLNFGRIWSALKRGYNRFLQGYDWWRRHVLAPLERMRKQIWQIYRTFFKPLVQFIDALRVFTRMIAIFNRKLAARLDHYLMALEGKILLPITALLHRVNAISSYFTALITEVGHLARPLLLESMRRDALLVWEVLTNPRAVLYSPPEPALRPTVEAAGRDFREYLEHGTGTLAMTEVEDHASLLQGFEEAS
jgi:hypothetical protein